MRAAGATGPSLAFGEGLRYSCQIMIERFAKLGIGSNILHISAARLSPLDRARLIAPGLLRLIRP
jgi:acyl dehydratase